MDSRLEQFTKLLSNYDEDLIAKCYKVNRELKSINIKNNKLRPVIKSLTELELLTVAEYNVMVDRYDAYLEQVVKQKAEQEVLEYNRVLESYNKMIDQFTKTLVSTGTELPYIGPISLDKNIAALEKKHRMDFNTLRHAVNDHKVELVKPDEPTYNSKQESEYVETLSSIESFKDGVNIIIGTKQGKDVRLEIIVPQIIAFLDAANDLDKWFFKYKINETWTTIPLNDEGINKVRNILNRGTFDRVFNEISFEDTRKIITSDSDITQELLTIDMFSQIMITPVAKGNKTSELKIYADNGGSFYDSKVVGEALKLEVQLSRYQIFGQLSEGKKMRPEFNLNCLLYALKMSGNFSDLELASMSCKCFTRIVSKKQVEQLGVDYQFAVEAYKHDGVKIRPVVTKNSKQGKVFGHSEPRFIIKLALIRKHWMLYENVLINPYYISNMKLINEWSAKKGKPIEFGFAVYKSNMRRDLKKAHMSSLELIRSLEANGFTKKLTFSERGIMSSDLYQLVTSKLDNIAIHSSDMRTMKCYDKKSETRTVYYADCEADVVTSKNHTVYAISYSKRDSNDIDCIIGEDCIEQFLDKVVDNSIVYFHNLAYDSRLMSNLNILNAIDKSGKVMTQDISYEGKKITMKDSYSILSMPLRNFTKTFGLSIGEKEMFPYRYYTLARLDINRGSIQHAGDNEQNWNQQLFEDCVVRSGAKIDAETFDMKKYVTFYCNQDVRILKEGFDKFRQSTLQEPIGLDVDDFVSAPSLSNYYFNKNVYSKNANLIEYSGVPRAFIQQAVLGGRCMTKQNKKYHVKKELSDLDAASLYPSAMARLYTVEGEPVVLDDSQLNVKFLLECTAREDEQVSEDRPISAYVVEIHIKHVGKHLDFPLICKRDPVTKTNRNVNECVDMTVDNIALEDLVKHQRVEIDIVRGYYWTGNKDFTIRNVIKNLFNLRLEYKKQGSPVQEVIKLIMNSAYGKTIQQPIKTNISYQKVQSYHRIYSSAKQFKTLMLDHPVETDSKGKRFVQLQTTPCQTFCVKNHAKIREIYDINKNLCGVVVNKQIDTHYSNTLLGVQILSMSKRIMSEVMVLAQDLNVEIYYQDTDSMHIELSGVERLANEFETLYGRELVGNKLGQFNSDFEAGYKSVESYFLGKKAYIDKLTNVDGNVTHHIRMKGVDSGSVNLLVNTMFDGDPLLLYESLYNNKSVVFDLMSCKPRFKMNKNRTVSNVSKFVRTIKFLGEGLIV